MENPGKDRTAAAIEELIKGRGLAARLCKLVQSGDSLAAGALAEEVIASLSRALNALDPDASGRSPAGDAVCNNSEACGKKRKNSGAGRGGCRKRKHASQWRTVLSKTSTDEYSWRKYGQKEIHHSKYPRSYFRCTHKYDQSCQATKQVQISEDDPSLLVITYIGEHTCTNYHHNLIPTSSGPSIISFGSNATSNVTHDFSLPSSSLFPKRLEIEDEVLSNPKPSTSSSEFFDLPCLSEGSLREPLMDEPAFLRGIEGAGNFDMSFMLDSFNFEEDVIAFDQGHLFGG